jgi:S-phase kinase-associated protein 1
MSTTTTKKEEIKEKKEKVEEKPVEKKEEIKEKKEKIEEKPVEKKEKQDDSKNDEEIELITNDNVKIKVKRKYISMSVLIKDMLEEQDDDDKNISIPVPNVDSKILKKVIEYCEQHWNNKADEIEKPLKGHIDDVICDWDKKYLQIDQSVIIELIMASNYLNIKDLLDLTCAKTAHALKGKTTEQIREMFGIVNDFTKEEQEKIREENKWCEES